MMKRFLTFAAALCLALTLTIGCNAEQTAPAFELNDFTTLYGYELPTLDAQAKAAEEAYQALSFAGVQVTLKQVVYDGVWMFTAAAAAPENPQEVVVMPGSASPRDRYAGMNDEERRTETRSFLELAKQENRRLLAVYAYPKEFDVYGSYFMDHLQDSGDLSLLVAGCNFVAPSDAPMTLHWMVQVYEVDVDTQAYTLLEEKLLPLTLQPMPSTATVYAATDNSTRLTGCTVLRTALTTYVFPAWEAGTDPYAYGTTLLDDAGNPCDVDLPWAYNSHAIDAAPATLTLQVENYEDGSVSTVTLTQR